MKKISLLILAIIFLVCCEQKKIELPKEVKTEKDTSFSVNIRTENKQSEPKSSWKYAHSHSQLNGGASSSASIKAKEPSKAIFTVGKVNNGICVYLLVPKGEYNHFNKKSIKIKFDVNQPEQYSINIISNLIYIESEIDKENIISKLKTAKRMIIEADFFREGIRQIEFSTDGFKWE
ncbi:MAG: hypothetical protein ABSG15_07540 [FCB group bacterium]|jgi:hypothetical protein